MARSSTVVGVACRLLASADAGTYEAALSVPRYFGGVSAGLGLAAGFPGEGAGCPMQDPCRTSSLSPLLRSVEIPVPQ